MNAYPERPRIAVTDRRWFALGDYDADTAQLLAETEDWLPALRHLRLSGEDMRGIFFRARSAKTSFLSALIESGLSSEKALTRALAASVGLDFSDSCAASRILGSDEDCLTELGRPNPIATAEAQGAPQATTALFAPRDVAPSDLLALASSVRRQGRRMALVPPRALRSALVARVAPRLTADATNGLRDWRPDLSARDRTSPHQSFLAGLGLALFLMLLWTAPMALFIGIHIVCTVFFLACSGLKGICAWFAPKQKPARRELPPNASKLPIYSVLVALHREAEVVPQLLVALGRIVWPRDRLEIKLVCEADDRATIDAIKALSPRSYIEIVEVPPSLPRTKPKALRFAMALTTGDFIVLYDAEDRPHPDQLVEAYARFCAAGPEVVCLQAPLHVTNARRSLLSRMFAFEYAGLFRSVLPWLAAHKQVLPLGGTSNHFRRAALEEIGSWDPHNVTEDADVGVRMCRFGYRAETIALPTLEAAPEELRVWLPQRTRWLKGWLQTWLVHMRHPASLLSEVGLVSFLFIQILLAGMFFSALLHPIIFLSAIAYSVLPLVGLKLANWQLWLVGFDWALLIMSYAVFVLLGWRSLSMRERIGLPIIVAMTPVYWLLTSYAAWLALFELIRHPHRWNKTPHKAG